VFYAQHVFRCTNWPLYTAYNNTMNENRRSVALTK